MAENTRALEQLAGYLKTEEQIRLLELAQAVNSVEKCRQQLQQGYEKLRSNKVALGRDALQFKLPGVILEARAYLDALKLGFLARARRWQEASQQLTSRQHTYQAVKNRLEALEQARRHLDAKAQRSRSRRIQKELDEFASRARQPWPWTQVTSRSLL